MNVWGEWRGGKKQYKKERKIQKKHIDFKMAVKKNNYPTLEIIAKKICGGFIYYLTRQETLTGMLWRWVRSHEIPLHLRSVYENEMTEQVNKERGTI